MLLSMTGYGQAQTRRERLTVTIETRSVNNRSLKVIVRGTDPYPLYESEFENVIRRHVRRGTVTVQVRVDRQPQPPEVVLDTEVLKAYLRQIGRACAEAGASEYTNAILSGLLLLPGIVPGVQAIGTAPPEEWPLVEETLEAALESLNRMRAAEGQATAIELEALHAELVRELAAIRERMPSIIPAYRQRLLDRIRSAVAESGVDVQPEHLLREVALYADRVDVSEEATRLTAHCEQLLALIRDGREAGRKIDFVLQEIGREANTLGSKAGDVTVSRHVIEIKAIVEKLRELVRNVE